MNEDIILIYSLIPSHYSVHVTSCYESIHVFKLYDVVQHFSTVTINAKPFIMGTVFMQGQFELRRFTVKEKVNAFKTERFCELSFLSVNIILL